MKQQLCIWVLVMTVCAVGVNGMVWADTKDDITAAVSSGASIAQVHNLLVRDDSMGNLKHTCIVATQKKRSNILLLCLSDPRLVGKTSFFKHLSGFGYSHLEKQCGSLVYLADSTTRSDYFRDMQNVVYRYIGKLRSVVDVTSITGMLACMERSSSFPRRHIMLLRGGLLDALNARVHCADRLLRHVVSQEDSNNAVDYGFRLVSNGLFGAHQVRAAYRATACLRPTHPAMQIQLEIVRQEIQKAAEREHISLGEEQ